MWNSQTLLLRWETNFSPKSIVFFSTVRYLYRSIREVILCVEQVENAPKFPQPSEGENQFTNGFQNLTNKHPFSSCSLLLAVLVLERKVIPNTAFKSQQTSPSSWPYICVAVKQRCVWRADISDYNKPERKHYAKFNCRWQHLRRSCAIEQERRTRIKGIFSAN